MSRQLLSISREGKSTTGLGNLFQCSVTCTVKLFLMFRLNCPVFQFVPMPKQRRAWSVPWIPSLQMLDEGLSQSLLLAGLRGPTLLAFPSKRGTIVSRPSSQFSAGYTCKDLKSTMNCLKIVLKKSSCKISTDGRQEGINSKIKWRFV